MNRTAEVDKNTSQCALPKQSPHSGVPSFHLGSSFGNSSSSSLS